MKFLLIYILIAVSANVHSQGGIADFISDRAEDSIPPRTVRSHTSLKPLIRQEAKNQDSYFKVEGLVDINYFQNNYTGYRAGAGVSIKSEINNKWFLKLAGTGGIYKALGDFGTMAFYREKLDDLSVYSDLHGRLSYTPNKIFNFQIGLDQNFIGEGARSLMLSDYGTAYPFAQIRMNFWRIEYSIMYQFLRERRFSNWQNKFAASHHISFNPTKWLNIGFFESVVFQPKDTLNNRGFEVEYLNPFVFYRPQEYALGSADNVLIGFELNAFIKKHTIYSQLMLDEFSLTEVRNRTRWWATKFGAQIGVKGRFNKGDNKFFYRVESNLVRPYTYAHISNALNYGNQNSTLAHPYGSNFMEILFELKWNKGKLFAELFTTYFLRSYDKDGFNFGNDIYTPYVNRPYEYGHTIGQGQGYNGTKTMLKLGYKISKHGNLSGFIENHFDYNTFDTKLRYSVVVGVRSALWNDYRNY